MTTNVGEKLVVSTTFRNLSEASVEELYLYFYRKQVPRNEIWFPSRASVELVNKGVFEFLDKEESIKLVATKNYYDYQTQDEQGIAGLTRFMRTTDKANDKIFLFEVKPKGYKFPILIKIEKSDDDFYFASASFDNQEVNDFATAVFERFGVKPDYKNQIYFGVLYKSDNEIIIKKLPLDDAYTKNMDIGLNYGQDFSKHHDTILSKLEKNKHGLFLFHGSAGTGKTTYIKYLAKLFGGKRNFIFIPSTMIDTLVAPSIIPILLDNKNSILVLEDAEKAIVSREDNLGNESLVSSLLNIGDGILGSMLNLSLVLTFNTGKERVDEALLRKGRLLYEYEFGPLKIPDAQILADKLKKGIEVQEPMTLAEIYNLEDETGHKEDEEEKRVIGFVN